MYLIRDKINTAQRFPLLLLLERIFVVIFNSANVNWNLAKVRGYGPDVCALEDKTLEHDDVQIMARTKKGSGHNT